MSIYRNNLIFSYVKGKEVLDLGSTTNKKNMFDIMKKLAKDLVGVDIRRSDDPKIVEGNVETVDLNRKFDLIIAGEIIEHLSNPGIFLDNMKKHLKNDGQLLITTPNAKSFAYLFFKGNSEHTCWYCRNTLNQLLKRHGFKIKQVRIYVQKKNNLVYDILRYFFANNLIAVCEEIKS